MSVPLPSVESVTRYVNRYPYVTRDPLRYPLQVPELMAATGVDVEHYLGLQDLRRHLDATVWPSDVPVTGSSWRYLTGLLHACFLEAGYGLQKSTRELEASLGQVMAPLSLPGGVERGREAEWLEETRRELKVRYVARSPESLPHRTRPACLCTISLPTLPLPPEAPSPSPTPSLC